MALSAGTRLGPYEILAPIGAGGMGEVYRAHDPRTGRDVAVKVSAERFSERFEREARAIASLNHPNICSLFDVGASPSGSGYLVMELVDGPTLAERIKQGVIPLEEARAIARQIAAALEAAHDKGVVHRDLKPGNVKIKPDGTVKVLDFGLAKMGGTPAAPTQDSPTISMAATQAGVILGTLAYMSPEQAKGKTVDQRADIWAFGVVLFEMVTGKPLFHGDSTTEILASVIKEEPQWDQAPVEVRRLLRRCLEKDPQKRLRHIGDAMALWDDAPAPVQPPVVPAPKRTSWLWPSVAAVLAIAAVALAFLYLRPAPVAPAEATRFEIVQPGGVNFSDSLDISPDGRKLAFLATGASAGSQNQVWVRSLDAVEARLLAGTEGVIGRPFWSPDSRYIVFWAGGKLQKIEAAGGPAQTLSNSPASNWGGFWSRDDKIVFGNNAATGLSLISAAGGAATTLTSMANGEQRHGYPALLPDGRHFVYMRAVTPTNGGIYLGSLDSKPDAKTNEPAPKKLLPDVSAVAYAPSADSTSRTPKGYLLFVRGGTLMAQPFDNQKLEMSGEAVPIAERISLAGFSVSDTGVLSYRNGAALPGQQFTWFDREGKVTGMVGEPASLAGINSAPALSPDEKRAAFAATDAQSGNTDIWLYDFARGTTTRFTFDPGQDITPVWSPDGGTVAFAAQRGGVWGIYQKASNLTGGENLIYKAGDVPMSPTSWSRDGKFLLYQTGAAGVLALPLTGGPANGSSDAKPIALLPPEPGEPRGARFSPDGRFFSYISGETGKEEIYVQTFDPPGSSSAKAAGGKWMVSKGGGLSAHWRGDGKEIFYLAPNGDLMSVDVSTTPVFQAGVPKRLFNPKAASRYWDVSSDGRRFVIPVPVGQASAAPYTVVLNWQAGLKK